MINQCTRIGNIAGLYGNHRLCIWEIENMDISNQGGRRIDRQTFLTLTFSERYHYKLIQDFPSSTQPWNPLSMFFPVLDTCLFSPSSSSSSTWQVSQIQPVIFNKLLKLSTGFVLEDLEMTKQWLFALSGLSGETLGWGNGAGRRSWPPRRLQAVRIHTGLATKISLWPVLAAPLALH